ncbi:hypothetical protein BC826DRAFT_995116 [Russula brevipes]|nr:hypothetical protein BC826DRAFT_995116 [Russula brevipes]
MSKAAPGRRPSEHAVGEPPRKKLRKLDYDAPEYEDLNVSPSEFAIPRNSRDAMEPKSEVSLHNTNFASLPLTLISPIFGRIQDDVRTPQEDLRPEDFAPARNLANMLSMLVDDRTRTFYFRNWLLETLEVNVSDSMGELSLSEPHVEGALRPAAMSARGILGGVLIEGHVEWKDRILIVTEGETELARSFRGLMGSCWPLFERTTCKNGALIALASPACRRFLLRTMGESIDCWFPYRNSYTDQYNTEQTFEYDSRLTPGPLVFVAKHTDPKVIPNLIVVKFTHAYSKAAHNLLAAKGFAPKLFAVEDLAGGWKMVVMEFLLDSDWTMLEMKTHEERLRYKEKLWEALCVIHDKGLVHGDVRDPNIFVSENGDVKLIDFDQCGTHEQDKYPREWDHTNRSVDAKEGALMRKEHDVFLFDRIFDNSQS